VATIPFKYTDISHCNISLTFLMNINLENVFQVKVANSRISLVLLVVYFNGLFVRPGRFLYEFDNLRETLAQCI
jgi:hypothetical protein